LSAAREVVPDARDHLGAEAADLVGGHADRDEVDGVEPLFGEEGRDDRCLVLRRSRDGRGVGALGRTCHHAGRAGDFTDQLGNVPNIGWFIIR
jgi:hypothetical protein